jgi:hypothetical protein
MWIYIREGSKNRNRVVWYVAHDNNGGDMQRHLYIQYFFNQALINGIRSFNLMETT